MANKVQLNSAVAQEYELVDWVGGYRQDFGKYGIVDLELMTTQQANSLVRQGFSKLRRKPAKAETTTKK